MERRLQKRWRRCDSFQILAAVLIVAGITMVIVGMVYVVRNKEEEA
jgi:hypothetical protein